MTTVAWDGRVMAADKLASCGGTPIVTTKVAKIETLQGIYLVGFAGRLADGQAFMRFAERGFEDVPAINDLTAMVIHENGRVVIYTDTNANPCDMGVLPRWAIGSGAEYALGAMYHGANAFRAVSIAIELDINTGTGIDTVDFS